MFKQLKTSETSAIPTLDFKTGRIAISFSAPAFGPRAVCIFPDSCTGVVLKQHRLFAFHDGLVVALFDDTAVIAEQRGYRRPPRIFHWWHRKRLVLSRMSLRRVEANLWLDGIMDAAASKEAIAVRVDSPEHIMSLLLLIVGFLTRLELSYRCLYYYLNYPIGTQFRYGRWSTPSGLCGCGESVLLEP